MKYIQHYLKLFSFFMIILFFSTQIHAENIDFVSAKTIDNSKKSVVDNDKNEYRNFQGKESYSGRETVKANIEEDALNASTTIELDVMITPTGKVVGSLYNDINGDGHKNFSEPGLKDIEVIVTDAKGVIQTVKTDEYGNYKATDLAEGNATIDIDDTTLPIGAVQTGGTDPTTVKIIGDPDVINVEEENGFQIMDTGNVWGHLYNDLNGNQIQDYYLNEKNLVDVDVAVTDLSGTKYTVTTDSNGDYYATDVIVGNVIVDIDETTMDPGFIQTQGGDPTTVKVIANTDNFEENNGFKKFFTDTPTGDIRGHVYNDLNGNETQDVTEPNLQDIDIIITDAKGNKHSVITDANGDYNASNVAIGDAIVDIDMTTSLSGFIQTEGTNPTHVYVYSFKPFNFEENNGFKKSVSPGTGSIMGRIYRDANGNGQLDFFDSYFLNTFVEVIDAKGISQQVTTNLNGIYVAKDLAVGNAIVTILQYTLPTGYVQKEGSNPTIAKINADITTFEENNGFMLEIDLVTVKTVDNSTPSAGDVVTFTITVTNTSMQHTATNISLYDLLPAGLTYISSSASPLSNPLLKCEYHPGTGEWTIPYISSGETVTLTISAKVDAGTEGQTITNTTTPAFSVSSPDPTTAGDDLNASITIKGMQFGNLWGHIYNDINENGIQDAIDPDLQGVPVTVTDASGSIQTVKTDKNGDYNVTVSAGNATVDIDDTILLIPAFLQTEGSDPTIVKVIANTDNFEENNGFNFRKRRWVYLFGLVYNDLNGNGIRDAAEPGLKGVDVITTDANGITQKLKTNSWGYYRTIGIAAGKVIVDIDDTTLPQGVEQTGGSDPTTIDINKSGYIFEEYNGFHFKESNSTVLWGHVYNDYNGNGILDFNEPGLKNFFLKVKDANGVNWIVKTNSHGDYKVTGLSAGNATVSFMQYMINSVLTGGTDPTVVNVIANIDNFEENNGFHFKK